MAKNVRAVLEQVRQSDEYWEEWLTSEFTEELSRRLEHLGLSRTAFAQKINVAPPYVTRVLRGEENLTIKTMAKLARAVGSIVRVHLTPVGTYGVWIDMPNAAKSFVPSSNVSDVVAFKGGETVPVHAGAGASDAGELNG